MIKITSLIAVLALTFLVSSCLHQPRLNHGQYYSGYEESGNVLTGSSENDQYFISKNVGSYCEIRTTEPYLRLGTGTFSGELSDLEYYRRVEIHGANISYYFNGSPLYEVDPPEMPSYLMNLTPWLTHYSVINLSSRDFRNVISGLCDVGRLFSLDKSGRPAYIDTKKTLLLIAEKSYGTEWVNEYDIMKTWLVIQSLKKVGLISVYDAHSVPDDVSINLTDDGLSVFVFNANKVRQMK